MRVAVVVPTTAGPCLVTKIAAKPNLPCSQVNTDQDYRPLDGVSERYHEFVAEAGPLRQAVDLPAGQMELRLDKPIESGRSWELPFALAHHVIACGGTIDTDQPELVIWATGSLNTSLEITPQRYHAAEKLALSQELFEKYDNAGAHILVLVPPEANEPQAASDKARTSEFHRVETLTEAIAACKQVWPTEDDTEHVPAARLRAPVLLFGGILAIAGVAAGLVYVAGPQSQSGAPTPQPPEAQPQPQPVPAPLPWTSALRLIEHRPPAGMSCKHVLFTGVAPVVREQAPDQLQFADMPRDHLCRIGFKLTGGERPSTLTLDDTFNAQIHKSDRRNTINLVPGVPVMLHLIGQRRDTLNYTFSLKRNGDDKAITMQHRLTAGSPAGQKN